MCSVGHPHLQNFTYERGEGRYKHRWKFDRAGFLPSKRGPVGKCHSSITTELAQDLLRTGIPEPTVYEDEDTSRAPDRIFNVYRGVPYVAVPTGPGKSYHGYPWRGRMSATVRGELRSRAEAEGNTRTFDKWLNTYSTN